ncbi:MAG: hypothetical protein J7L04_09075 [Bacteroidales bacterium]|nr:hypothetical protein [Bacteroidales bacterium]
MKTRIILSTLLFFAFLGTTFAQGRQEGDTDAYRSLIPIDKQNRLKNIDFIGNMQFAERTDFTDGEYMGSRFKMEQFRMEMKGWVTDRVFFRFRHRYTSTFEPQDMDKIIKGVDMAFITVKLDKNDKWQMSAGKMCVDWGGIEFDLNPAYIYEYSDIIEMADNFMSGVQIQRNFSAGNSLGFEIMNTRTQSFEELYGNDSIIGGLGIKQSLVPLAGIFTWRGKFGRFSTLYSASVFTEAENYFSYYLALGNMLTFNKVRLSYDFKISKEELDRTGIVSQTIPRNEFKYTLTNTLYYSHWLQVEWRFKPKWQLAFVGFIDQAKWMGDEDPTKTTDKIRTGYGFIPTIEYYPWNDIDMKFFAGYVGRVYDYSDYATSKTGTADYRTGRIMVGFISALKFL